MTEDGADVSAVCGMLDYIRETQKRNIARFVSIEGQTVHPPWDWTSTHAAIWN